MNNEQNISVTLDKLAFQGKGILAADESSPTIEKRFSSVGVESTPESRHHYRHTIFSSEGLEKYISGVILFDETIRNRETVQPLIDKGIQIGIKVDKGAKSFREQGACCGSNEPFVETITEGLDGLSERLKEYKEFGATFAKWRAVLSPKSSRDVIEINNLFLAIYAKKCQELDIVPIVEPEVLMDGEHPMYASYQTTDFVISNMFEKFREYGVDVESIILKPNMVVSGYDFKNEKQMPTVDQMAEATTHCLKKSVPACVRMVAFLSGGQPDGDAVINLNAINQVGNNPWYLSFSFGRELQGPALKAWASTTIEEAQKLIVARAEECSSACLGQFTSPIPDVVEPVEPVQQMSFPASMIN